MKVAPSFTDYIRVSDIYDKNGKKYIIESTAND